ncbi:MAG: NFACT RNA binding domain-containing protein [Myxococcota bacterium]
MDAVPLDAIVEELGVLVGARLQRLDVVDERELVLELRVPGRTLRLLASARPGRARVHLVAARPDRVIAPGPLQAFLRQRLVGQRLAEVGGTRHVFRLKFERDTLTLDLRGGKKALVVAPEGAIAPEARVGDQLPEMPHNEAAALAAESSKGTDEEGRWREMIARTLRVERKKSKKLEANLHRDLERLERYAGEGHRGELMKSALARITRGDKSFRAFDWLSGAEVEVPLDPARTPQENLQRFFSRAKKATRGLPRVEARLEGVWARLEDIEGELNALSTLGGADLRARVETLAAEGFDKVVAAPRERRPVERVARRFLAKDGSEIWVGRGAADNDRLTFQFSKGDDVWVHARGTPGAHVVVRAQPGQPPVSETILDAAHLALHHSSLKNEGKAEVLVAEVRHVKKTKGAPAGLVGVAKSRTLLVELEAARIDRLYGRSHNG